MNKSALREINNYLSNSTNVSKFLMALKEKYGKDIENIPRKNMLKWAKKMYNKGEYKFITK